MAVTTTEKNVSDTDGLGVRGPQNIVLIGFMGAGKSSVAQHLHELYQMDVAEMDDMIVEREGMSIPEIFASKGEAYFRSLETALLQELQKKEIGRAHV